MTETITERTGEIGKMVETIIETGVIEGVIEGIETDETGEIGDGHALVIAVADIDSAVEKRTKICCFVFWGLSFRQIL